MKLIQLISSTIAELLIYICNLSFLTGKLFPSINQVTAGTLIIIDPYV